MSAATARKSFLIVLAASAMALLGAMPAQASYLKRELAGGWGAAIESDGAGGHYVGGSFQAWNAESTGGAYSLKSMAYSGGAPTNSGTLDTAFKTFDGGYTSIHAVLEDGAGGWYVGGGFTRYGGTKTNTLAHINANGTLDTNFQANIPMSTFLNGSGCEGGIGGVWTLVRDGSTLYVGGRFDTVNGVSRTDVAAVDATTGAVKTAFNANITRNADNYGCQIGSFRGVRALLLDGSGNLFIGGNFLKVGANNTQGIGKVNATTGDSDATFNGATSAVDNSGSCYGGCLKPVVTALATVDSDLWVGGNFYGQSLQSSKTRSGVMVISPTNQAIDQTKTTAAQVTSSNGQGIAVQDILPDGAGHVYVAGAFTSVGSGGNALTRSSIAEYDVSAGRYMSAFNASPDLPSSQFACGVNWDGTLTSIGGNSSFSEVVGLTLDGSTLYASGRFSKVGGVDRPGLAAVDSATGALNTSFSPAGHWASIGCGGQGGGVPAVVSKSSTNGALFVGGFFDSVGGTPVGGLVHVKADGTRDTAFNPSVVPLAGAVINCYNWCLPGVSALAKVGNKLYVGGTFDNINGDSSLNALAVLNTADGTNASQQVAGSFAKQGSGDGVTISASQIQSPQVTDLEVDGNTIWAGGAFKFNGSSGTNPTTVNIVGIDTATGVKTAFSTNPWKGGTRYSTDTYPAPPVTKLAVGANDLYVNAISWKRYNGTSGWSGNEGPQNSSVTSTSALAINKSTGAKSSAALGSGVAVQGCSTPSDSTTCYEAYANAIGLYNGKVYIGGSFNKVGGTLRSGVAELDPATGQVGSFDAQIVGACGSQCFNISSMVFHSTSMFIGGYYQSVKGVSRGGIAEIDMSTGNVTGFDPLDGSNFNSPALYLDQGNGKLYGSGVRFYPNDTDYPTVGVILDPTLKYSSNPVLSQLTFGYLVTLQVRPPSAPTITSPTASSTSNAGSVAFTGGDGNTFECQIDGGSWTTCTSPLDTSSLADGSHTVSVRQTDSQSRTSTASTVTWTVDRTPPATTPAATMTSPSSLTSNSTSQTTAQFTFGSLPSDASKMQCKLDSGAWADCTSPYSVSGLADGQHTVKFRFADGAGNTSTEQSITWGVYTSAPATPTITAPTGSSTSNVNAVTFTQVAGLTYKCQIDSGAIINPCTSPLSVSSLADGSHTVKVWAVNPFGTESASPAQVTWTRDTSAPSAPVIGTRPPSSTNATNSTVTFSGNPGTTFECKLDTGAWTTCTSPFSTGALGQGSHTLLVRSRDGAGNVGSTTTVTWTIDTVAPLAPVIGGIPSAPTTSTGASVSFAAERGSTIRCSVDGGPYGKCANPTVLAGLTPGAHTISARAVDAAGNVGPIATRSWTVFVKVVCTPPTLTKPTIELVKAAVFYDWAVRPNGKPGNNDPRKECALLTLQVSQRTSEPAPDLPVKPFRVADGVFAYSSFVVTRIGVPAPLWVRVGNQVGQWSAWTRTTVNLKR